jgi:hypothetical protein
MFGLSRRAAWTSLLSAVLLILSGNLAMAGELLMFETRSCPWCKAWNRDIGRMYDKTEQGKLLKLHRVDLDREDENKVVRLARPVMFTPVFVISACGREVGRVEGYPGKEFFWTILNAEIERNRAQLAAPC